MVWAAAAEGWREHPVSGLTSGCWSSPACRHSRAVFRDDRRMPCSWVRRSKKNQRSQLYCPSTVDGRCAAVKRLCEVPLDFGERPASAGWCSPYQPADAGRSPGNAKLYQDESSLLPHRLLLRRGRLLVHENTTALFHLGALDLR